MIGIIGGSGLYEGIPGLKGERKVVKTPYGEVTAMVGKNFAFVSRHGSPPKPPHMVNYHANIYAFRELGIKDILAISSVGSLREELSPGTILLPQDLLDFTPMVWTYHDEEPVHVNLYEPFCPELRERVSKLGVKIGGTYATTKGPQFETRAEVRMLKTLGADVVGMTVAPEARLARELGLCYQPLCVVVNYVDDKTTHHTTLENMKKNNEKILEILERLLL